MTKPTARARGKPQPSYAPHRCVVVAVDPGDRAGWSIWVQGRLADFGELRGYDHEGAVKVVCAAQLLAELAEVDGERVSLPCVLVIERPFAANLTTAAGMGAMRGVWLAAWESGRESSRRVVLVYPAVWRSKVLPKGCASMKRELVRPIEQRAAGLLVAGELGAKRSESVGPDSAPAVLIGQWAGRAGEVAKKLPKRARAVAA